jgi:exonuclease SbcC
MIAPKLDSLAITNFRSIKGTITLPLGAPVVLIHGANGTGKTSILSALEIALTGEVAAFRRSDSDYFEHLPNLDSTETRIGVNLADDYRGPLPLDVNMLINRKGPQSKPLLDSEKARFFEERCYLAQSTLGRLLEIYQHADTKNSESPLTRFVKDVLGLDQLDALIEGLHAADHITRVRKLVLAFADTEHAKGAATERVRQLNMAIGTAEQSFLKSQNALRQSLPLLPGLSGHELFTFESAELEALLSEDREERDLIRLAGIRRQLASLRSDWNVLSTGPEAEERASVEHEVRLAATALENWRRQAGVQLEAIVEGLRPLFPDLPSLASTDPHTAAATATSRVATELKRCNNDVIQDDHAIERLGELGQSVARGRARIALIDAQIAELAVDAASLSRVLAGLMPHVRGEQCPVCDRDYSEVSKVPLLVHLSSRLSQLTEKGDRLQALSKARAEALGAVSLAEREREAVSLRRLSQEARVSLKAKVSELADVHRRLLALKDIADSGSVIVRRDAEATGRLAKFQERDRQATTIAQTLTQLYQDVLLRERKSAEPLSDSLDALEGYVVARESSLAALKQLRHSALTEFWNLRKAEETLRGLRKELTGESATLSELEKALEFTERRRQDVRRIAAAARKTRANIVSRVFNESLNAVWRDLFVRLAPTEPFVPAFKLPESADGPIVATLETIHRGGGRGGAPGAMLSAGNLNTAALTLFLALHLSVAIQLPWLILDDPVQSMDEVHVSHFAALLRTLSKNHNRQIIIAVHDRALFDYLTLELSPAFENDQLVTVQLGRSDSGASLAEPEFHRWEPDSVLAAG